MKTVRCYWKQDGALHRTDVDNHVEDAFTTYGEVVEFVKANLSVTDNTKKFAVMAVVA
jgi:hypothetical protein